MHTLLKTLPAFLAAWTAAGALAGAALGGRFLAAGFPLLWLDAVRGGATAGALGAAGFLVLFEAFAWLGERGLPARWTRAILPLAAAAAFAPFVALAGYRLNRAWGVRPSQVFETYGLVRNLAFLALASLAFLAISWGLRRLRDRPAGPRWPLLAATAALVLAVNAGVWAAFRAGKADPPGPDVILLLVDALRADHLSSAGYPRETTPAIDALAADGVLFRQAISHSTFTKSSIASLLTGRYPYQHGLYWGNLGEDGTVRADVLQDGELTLAEALRERGYLTAAWVQNSHLTAEMGFDQGFVTYLDHQGPIERIHRLFRRWLRGPGRRYGFFAYLHYIDLHDPYRPPPPYDTLFGDGHDPYAGVDLDRWGAFLKDVRDGTRELPERDVERFRDLYDGQLREIDDEIGRLLDVLRRLDLYDGSLILLTSDHGDGFLEHGFISHSTTPYDELVRVPLVVKFPEGRFRGRRVDEQVRLVDVLPTVLAAVGGDRRPDTEGCSLLPLLLDPAAERAARCGEAVIEIAEDGGAYPIAALRTARYKYIHHELRDDELYDLEADPGERANLAADRPEVAEHFRNAALAVVARRPETAERIELDERQIEELKALGYLD